MEKHSLKPQYDAIIVPAKQYDLSTDDRELIPFIRYDALECKKIGFVNREGEVVVKPQYDMYSPGYKDDAGYIKVAKDIIHKDRLTTLYGLIDSTGEVVLPLEYRTLLPPIDSQDLYMVQDINYRYGVVRSSGEMVVPFGEYNWIDGFDHGLARVIGHDAAGRKKWGVIDETGELVVPMKYDSIRNFYGKDTQSIILVSGSTVGRVAFVDIVKEDTETSNAGDNMMNEEYMRRIDNKDDAGYIKVAKDIIHKDRLTTLYGLIDSTGEVVLPLEYRRLIPPIDSQDLYMVQDINYRYGVVRSSGEMVVPFGEYNWIDGFDHGLARVIGYDAAGRKKWGVIDETGELVVPMEYDSIRNFYGKNTQSISLVSGNTVRELAFADIVKEDNVTSKTEDNMMNEEDMCYLDDYGREYGEYSGSYAQDVAGYSDDVINDAFEGDPEIYWNID
ncbi:MAG: WG repeat-containing protein [Bacteroidales bacterium]|nr:WG repeat-containing protein [Bacteroidales bacterium]